MRTIDDNYTTTIDIVIESEESLLDLSGFTDEHVLDFLDPFLKVFLVLETEGIPDIVFRLFGGNELDGLAESI